MKLLKLIKNLLYDIMYSKFCYIIKYLVELGLFQFPSKIKGALEGKSPQGFLSV